jgi:hypothetical protein
VAGKERGLLIKDYISRIMRGVQQDMEAMAESEPSVDDLSKSLRDM